MNNVKVFGRQRNGERARTQRTDYGINSNFIFQNSRAKINQYVTER